MRLPEVIFTQTVTGEYPDDDSMIDPLERDMQLYPDPNTIRFVPWALEPTAQVIHDCFDVNGKLIDIAPRPCCAGFCHSTRSRAGSRWWRRSWSSTW